MKYYHVDAFTSTLFGGNPAAVCLLGETWLPVEQMQLIAKENNLSETAFAILKDGERSIRWFTPVDEVDLCGHATLATGHVIFNHTDCKETTLTFQSRKGILKVKNEIDRLVLDFPINPVQAVEFEDKLDCFNVKPIKTFKGTGEYLLVFENEQAVKNAVCNLPKAALIDLDGFIITAQADAPTVDFVSRYFSPKFGLNEDPVTGSAHTILAPYWQTVLGKSEFKAMQISERVGHLSCKIEGDRVKIGGQAVTYAIGELFLETQV